MDTDKNAHGCYNNDVKGVTTDIFKFEEIIRCDLLYVDKTKYIYDLVGSMDRRFFFLSRPRRFGKSLFCSTLHALFDGRRDLFKGLYIAEETDYSFEKYPVIHLDFSKMSLLSEQSVFNAVQKGIIGAADANGISIGIDDPSLMLDDLITRAMEKTGKPVVIIIDEFDSPFTSEFGSKPEFIEYMRKLFNGLYKTIKADSGYIRFFFITGCVKLANLSIFSAMNNLKDISMDPRFAGAFGYTDEEVERFFGEGIDEYLATNPEKYGSREDFIKAIRDYYDGYRFSSDSETRVYNPVSIGSFFSDGCVFRNYWNATGVSTMAVELARRYDLLSIVDEMPSVDMESFTSFDISLLSGKRLSIDSIYALLYFAGYMTIHDGNELGLMLRFPNREISSSFSKSLASAYTENGIGGTVFEADKAACRGDIDGFISILRDYYSRFPYLLFDKRNERFFHLLFHAFMVSLGMDAYAEDAGSIGRADEVLITDRYIYIFELKIDRSAAEALEQIKDRHYADKHIRQARDGKRKIMLIGISISSETRNITEYMHEEFDLGC